MCSESTFGECMEKMLFGESDTQNFAKIVSQIKVGDSLFLYNTTTRHLHGEFVAESDGARDIDPVAWKGKFPWQIKVNWRLKFLPIIKESFEPFVKFKNGRYPQMVLEDSQVSQLRNLFLQAKELPSSELEFRSKFSADYRAKDGHNVKSKNELLIDNYLFEQGICHGSERKLPTSENLYCDFWIPRRGQETVYIEYWGMDDKRYNSRKQSKQEIYSSHNMPLIEINPDDIKILDDVMPGKLRTYLPDFKFI